MSKLVSVASVSRKRISLSILSLLQNDSFIMEVESAQSEEEINVPLVVSKNMSLASFVSSN